MSAHGFIDWGVAERVALALGGNDGARDGFDQAAVNGACADAVALVLDYSRLRPAGELPQPSSSIGRVGPHGAVTMRARG